MKILIACEYSGKVRDAFIRKGHEAISCDILDTTAPGPHIKDDLKYYLDDRWDMIIAFPPCTYLTLAGNRWYAKSPLRAEACRFVEKIWEAPVEKICIENPKGVLTTQSSLGKYTQIVHPWEHGEEFIKPTCLWLKNLPPLEPTEIVDKGEVVIHGGKPHPKWYSNRERPRDLTFDGIANAMAEQWG